MLIQKSCYSTKKINKGYLSEVFVVALFLIDTNSDEECVGRLPKSSTIGKINEDNNGSGATLFEEATREDPPKSDCSFPSRSSLFNKESFG